YDYVTGGVLGAGPHRHPLAQVMFMAVHTGPVMEGDITSSVSRPIVNHDYLVRKVDEAFSGS
ncbi:MAG: hypothetical protein Q7O66_14285, partial [Dehalococcoidia bacterium]|nr:hypothetical protein [Dehalococcoidia bacterium]